MNLKSLIASSRGQYGIVFLCIWSSNKIALPILCTQTIANFGYKDALMLLVFILIIMTYIIRVVSQNEQHCCKLI